MGDGLTIVARASAPGRSLRCIVRLSGPSAFGAVASLAGGQAPCPRARGVHPLRLRLEVAGEPCAVPALALAMPAPRSFTGEDCLELLLPGNPAIADAACAALAAIPGVRAAHAGEFMARAHAAGRMPLEEAERIALTIAAQDAQELAGAQAVRSSPLVAAAHAAAGEIAHVLARVEAGIDFTDAEDVVAIDARELVQALSSVRCELEGWVARSMPAEAGRLHPAVALRGAPNAGKSTLFNALLGRTRAVASPVAGTTRDAISETMPIVGADGTLRHVTLVDLPGIEDPRSALDALMQGQRADALSRADLVLHCIPLQSIAGPVAPPAVAAALVPAAADGGRPGNAHVPPAATLLVVTRADEAPAMPIADAAARLRAASAGASGATGGAPVVVTSAVTGAGVAELRIAIAAELSKAPGISRGAGTVLALERHRHAMSRAAALLGAAAEDTRAAHGEWPGRSDAPMQVRNPEEVAHTIRAALDALGEVTGAVTPDDVLGLVFSRFCIGK